MKVLFLIATLTGINFGFGQSISGTKQRWAGGFSYAHGVNYMLTIRFPKEIDAKCVSLDSIHLDGYVFCNIDLKITVSDSSILLSFEKHFPLRDDQAHENNKNLNYLNKIFYHLNGKNDEFPIEKMTELFPLEYP